ncbi:hypothetical protein DRJ48_01750 [Candidatus Woesearchaeota archaeon]|nr:MAG: hypothetical protein DRJ48_01750 [Candidatus Woesearchaeota archaeon]
MRGYGKLSHKPVAIGFLALLLIATQVMAFPHYSTELFGVVIINGSYAPPDTLVTAYFGDGSVCGEVKLTTTGLYTGLSCVASQKRLGELVYFRVNLEKAQTLTEVRFSPGRVQKADIFTGDFHTAATLVSRVSTRESARGDLLGIVAIASGLLLLLDSTYLALKWKRKS